MKNIPCSKCAVDVQPIVVGESIVQCPHCFSDLSDKNDPVLSREVRREAIRNGTLPEAEIVLTESGSNKKGDAALVEDILVVAFEDLGLSESAAKIAAKGRK